MDSSGACAQLRGKWPLSRASGSSVKQRLGITTGQFEGSKEELFARGFPRPDLTMGLYDLKMIESWMDGRHANVLRALRQDPKEVFLNRALD